MTTEKVHSDSCQNHTRELMDKINTLGRQQTPLNHVHHFDPTQDGIQPVLMFFFSGQT